MGTPSFNDGISSGYGIGLPFIFKFGSSELKARVVPEVLLEKKKKKAYLVQHKDFDKRLIDQPVIRNKLAVMVVQLELIENWIENIIF